jgi:cytoplasmic iron level regulating protein YaaA (DUF328/UPF0246 family)
MPNFVVLLPPAETKQPGGNPFAPDMFDYRTSNTFNYFSDLNPRRRKLIDTLQGAMSEADDPGALFDDLEGFELEEAVRVNEEIYDAPLMSALDRYSPGALYSASDFADLPTGAQRRMLENGVIFSGLFGLLRPDDLVPNYHLGMTAELPDVGEVGAYWQPHISPLLNKALEGHFVWDFLPEHLRAIWDEEHTYEERARVLFVDEDESGTRSVPEEETLTLQGRFVNHIVRETLEDLDDLKGEEREFVAGFYLDEEASEYDEDTKTHTLTMVRAPHVEKAAEEAREE